jgi:hypothetical protein
MALMGFQRSLAVLIGINSYQDGIPSLQTPVADASSLAQLLRHHHGYGVKLLLNEGARGAALRALFEQELPRVVIACCFTSPATASPSTVRRGRRVT